MTAGSPSDFNHQKSSPPDPPDTGVFEGDGSVIPVLVLGTYITVLGSIRSLGRCGIPSYCVTDMDRYITRSRYYHPPPREYELITDPVHLPPYLENFPVPRAVLLPCADNWVQAVSRLDRTILERFPASLPSPEVLNSFVDKWNLKTVLDRFQIPRPKTVQLQSEEDLIPVLESPEGDWFIKPADSLSFRTHYQVKAFRVHTLDEALGKFRDFQKEGFAVLLQEYVPGSASCHYFVDGFVDREGNVKGLLARRRIRMHPIDFGDSSFMTTVPPEEVSDAIDSIKRLLGGLGYRGIFSVEFKRDPRDGQFKLIEVNTRPWSYVEFATSCGVNTPLMAYRDALYLDVPVSVQYSIGKSLCFLPNDLFACLALRRKKALTLPSWIRSWSGAQQAVFSWRDPLPSIARSLWLLSAGVRKLLRSR